MYPPVQNDNTAHTRQDSLRSKHEQHTTQTTDREQQSIELPNIQKQQSPSYITPAPPAPNRQTPNNPHPTHTHPRAMAPNRLGSLVPYDTPPPSQGNPQIPTTQSKTADKGPQSQKRKRAGSKPEKDQTNAPATSAQNQKKARTNREVPSAQGTDGRPPTPPSLEEQSQPSLITPTRGTTPQAYSFPDNTGRNSPSPPPSPTDEARKRKQTQVPLGKP